jgi:dTDP-D-glucose 4,6-dehydratase
LRTPSTLGWSPTREFEQAVAETVLWYRDVDGGASPADLAARQLHAFAAALRD